MATGNVGIDEAAAPDARVATHTISEDAVTKHLQRVVINTAAGADVDPSAIASVYAPIQLADVALSCDTAAYASGDLIADSQAVDAVFRAADALGVIQSVQVIDEDDQGAAIDIYFLSANSSLGTENAAPSITDANARNILGVVSVAAADYKDLGGVKVATKTGVGIVAKPATGTDDLYVAVVSNGSTPTYTATGLRLRVGVMS